ncbi:MAG: protein kinase domain-containing protein [Phycisphaerales bacterium]
MNVMLGVLGVTLIAILAAIVVVFLFVPVVKLIGKLIAHIVTTVVAAITDVFRFVGTVLVLPVFMVLAVMSVVFGRWSAAGHYGRAVSHEFRSAGLCLYRVVLGHPLKLVGLHALVEGFEKRLPEVMAAAPGPDKPRGRKNQFEGYTIVGSLAGGGSGGRLYIAEPDELKRAAFAKRGVHDAERVVIKTFSVSEGSTLPQIIRESRALDAAKRLGLILEHALTTERFFYVMRYIPGEPLSIITQREHAEASPEGLGPVALRRMLGYAEDVLVTLDRYHTGGLWHKDIKPDNIIVDQTGAHIVDLGLITPLRSAMTLTTHGTEYFRDPELVRMALKGVKVNEVNGEKFDIYAAAAVMYSMIENSFPAHGGLSQLTRRCPESVRWIIRRGMAEYDRRYETVRDMLADLRFVLSAEDPSSVKPAHLPSMRGVREEPPVAEAPAAEPVFAPPPPPVTPAPRPAAPVPPVPQRRPKVKVANWWTGVYTVLDETDAALENLDASLADARPTHPPAGRAARRSPVPPPVRRPAHEQLRNARARAAERRLRASQRVTANRRRVRGGAEPGLNKGVAVAIGVVVGLISIPVSLVVFGSADAISAGRQAAMQINAAGAGVSAPSAPSHPDAPHTPSGVAVAHASADVATADAAAAPSNPAASHGRAIVLSTAAVPVAPELAAFLDRSVTELFQSGFSPVSNIDASAVDDAAVKRMVEMRVEYDLGASLSDAARRIQSWFAQHGDSEYEVAVVLAPDPEAMARGEVSVFAVVADDNTAITVKGLDATEIARQAVRAVRD